MKPRARYLNFLYGKPVDRPPLQELPPWETTVDKWMEDTGKTRQDLLFWEYECDGEENVGIDFSMIPSFEEKVLHTDDQTFVKTDKMGLTYRQFKDNFDRSMPEYLDNPVKSVSDWKDIKRRFDPSSARYPQDWTDRLDRWQKEEPILRLYGWVATYFGGPSLYGFARMLMGTENLSYAFYDEPMMVHDMMETMTDFTIGIIQKALKEAPITLVQFWEDMCYKNGPLISPTTFKEFMLERYKRITRVIREAGVDIIFLDSDGNIEELLPLWIEAGINGLFPMEQAAGNDILEYRKKYGKNLLMSGGIDKKALVRGRTAIDEELEAKIPLALEGGYIPTVDHGIPPDVPYENFLYYWNRKKEMLGIKNVEPSKRHLYW